MKNNQNDKRIRINKLNINNITDRPGEISTEHVFYGDISPGADWEGLISKHKLRYDIWMFLTLYDELNVSEISKWVKQSKSTVSRVLISMERDELLVSRRGKLKDGDRERIPPKYYSISKKYKESKDREKKIMEIPSDPNKLYDFLLSEVRTHRNAMYNIVRLLNYLSSSLNQLDDSLKLGDIEKAQDLYNVFLSGVNEPEFNLVFLDKNRFKKFYDLRIEYILKLKKLVLEKELDVESVFVYLDSLLPLKTLLDLNKKKDK